MIKWTTQEEEHLRNLVENYGQSCWENISKEMNLKFNKTSRTGRQCRQKYINYARFSDIHKRSIEWTPEEEKILLKLYKDAGPSWSSFVASFPNKSQNSIKNKFYNNLRRISRKIEDNQKKFFKNCRSHIGYDSIATILEIYFQIQRWNSQNGRKCGSDSKIWQYKEKILQMAFGSTDYIDQTKLSNLITQIKGINKHLRCYGIFKSNNKKSWKLTGKRIESILRFDSVSSDISSEKKQLDSTFQNEEFRRIEKSVTNSTHPLGIDVEELQSLCLQDFENQFLISIPINKLKKLQEPEGYFQKMLKQPLLNESIEFVYN